MKFYSSFVAFAVMLFSLSLSAAEPGSFSVRGDISGIPDGTEIKLYAPVGDLLKVVGLDTVSGGHFSFTDTVSSPIRQLYLSSDSPGFPNRLVKVFVAPGSVTEITGNGPLHPLWRYKSTVPCQESAGRFIAAVMPEFEEYLRLDIEESDLMRYLYIENKGAQELEKPVWHKIDSIRSLAKPYQTAMDTKELEYMAKAPVDDVWLDTYRSYVERIFRNPDYVNADAVRRLFGRLGPDELSTPDGEAVSRIFALGQKLAVGDSIPYSDFVDINGEVHTLDEFPGKYILLDFWSQGCGPCVRSIPEAEEVAEQYADRLVFIGVSQDPVEMWKDFVETRGLNGIHWNGYTGNGISFYDRFGFNGIPAYALISSGGKIISLWSGYGPGSLKQAVGRHLSGASQPE